MRPCFFPLYFLLTGSMTTSLNSFIPFLSETLQLNASALYERLRALVRLGLLESVEGRGPGSGVRLGPDALATFLISLMASDTIADAAETTTALSNARLAFHTVNHGDALGGAKTFKEALVNILTIDAVAEQLMFVDVTRGEMPRAEIRLMPNEDLLPPYPEKHGVYVFTSDDRSALRVEGMIGRVALFTGTILRVRDRLKKIERSVEAKKAVQAAIKPS